MQTLNTVPGNIALAVERLLLQYQEYQLLSEAIKNTPPSDMRAMALLKQDRQQVSDEMTFANHVIWLMYKHRAYQGTAKALHTLGDLKVHCAPVDDICHKRWEFLKSTLPEVDTIFSDAMLLEKFCQEPKVLDLLSNIEFLEKWKEQEFFRANGQIKKWQKSSITN